MQGKAERPSEPAGSPSRAFGSPRRLKHVHFAELEQCFSSLALSKATSSGTASAPNLQGLSPQAHKSGAPFGLFTDDGEPLKREKRVRVEGSMGGKDTSRSMPGSPMGFLVGGSLKERNEPLARQQMLNLRPALPPIKTLRSFELSSSSERRSSSACSNATDSSSSSVSGSVEPILRFPSGSSGGPFSPVANSWSTESSVTRDADSIGRGTCDASSPAAGASPQVGALLQRRGKTGVSSLSLKRSRSEHRGWTGKREQVLGAEPGTPKLNKCDTL